MQRVADVLSGEHRLIRRAAACLERLADDALGGDALDTVAAVDVLEFFEDFADGAHQIKEERYLFPVLLDRGLATHRVRELLHGHEQERAGLIEMRRHLEGAAWGGSSSRERFVAAARDYARHQVEHVEAENDRLLPLIGELLDEDDERRVLAGFREIEARVLKREPREYAALVEACARRLGSIANGAGEAERSLGEDRA